MLHGCQSTEVGIISIRGTSEVAWAGRRSPAPRRIGSAVAVALCAVLGPSLSSAHAQDAAGLSWSLLKKPDCPPRSCWQVKVTAVATACPHGLYLSLNQWTQADVNSTTNVYISDVAAVIPRLKRGQTVIVTLPRSARTAESASLSEINCY